jgi:hypothetical protein
MIENGRNIFEDLLSVTIIMECMVIVFKVFCIKIIIFLFLKNYFKHQHVKTI